MSEPVDLEYAKALIKDLNDCNTRCIHQCTYDGVSAPAAAMAEVARMLDGVEAFDPDMMLPRVPISTIKVNLVPEEHARKAEAEVARMRSVVEAAVRWRDHGNLFANELVAAVDAYEVAKPEQPC